MSPTYKSRKANRLPNFNYSNNGYYFVTWNIHQTIKNSFQFGIINNNDIVLNHLGNIFYSVIHSAIETFNYFNIDCLSIQPDHFHGIFIISNQEWTGQDLTIRQKQHNLLSRCVRFIKGVTTKQIHDLGIDEFKWQRSFYDHIIRDEKELQQIRNYIQYNSFDH